MSRACAGRLVLLLVLHLAGCSRLLGLDEAEVDPGNDSDGDGVPFELDNCPLLPNPDQADRDGDTIGDVCDSCDACGVDGALGPDARDCGSHDEDGDGKGDACDPCPVRADVAGDGGDADADGDGVGDGCDPVFSAAHRLLLDPLLSSDGWVLGRNTTIGDDQAVVDSGSLRQELLQELRTSWLAEVGVAELGLGSSFTFGVASQFVGELPRAGCVLRRDAAGYTMTAVSDVDPVSFFTVTAASLPPPVSVRLDRKLNATDATCTLFDASGERGQATAETLLQSDDLGRFEVESTNRVVLRYLLQVWRR